MVLNNYQMSFGGLTFGAGTDVQFSGMKGFRGQPTIRSGDVQKARRNGSFPGLNFFDERVVEFDLQVFGNAIPSGLTTSQVLDNIATAFENIEDPSAQLPLSVMLPGWAEPRQLFCRPSNLDIPVDSSYVFNAPNVAAQLTANDPLIYSSTLHSVSTGLPSPTAGLTFPVTFPVAFGASTGGSVSVTNAGRYASPFVEVIAGPVLNPTITLGSQFFGLTITLGASDTIVIDMNARTVTLNGTASRMNAIDTGSSWLALPPGASSVGVQSQDSAAVAAVFTTRWYDAWGTL